MSKIDLRKEIGNRLKEARLSLSLTQAELGNSLDETRAVLSQVELGKAFPNSAILHKLHTKYNISIDWLISGEGNMKKDSSDQHNLLKHLYSEIPESEEWDRLLKIMAEQPQQSRFRLSELLKHEISDAGFFLSMGFKTLHSKSIIEGAFESKMSVQKMYDEKEGKKIT